MNHTLLGLRRTWSELPAPDIESLRGDFEASFVAPLRRLAPFGLGLIGLPQWYGKRLVQDPSGAREPLGVNLLRHDDGLVETIPMLIRAGISKIDGLPAVIVEYVPETRRPWPWVRDELRTLPDGQLLGMTIVDLPGFRMLGGTPFLLAGRSVD